LGKDGVRTRVRIREASLVSLALVAANYVGFYLFGWPLVTERIAEWIMAHTPNDWSVAILTTFGEWAKPFAATGGLAAVGFTVWVVLMVFRVRPFAASRRGFLTSAAMIGGTAAVAVESFARNRLLTAKSANPVPLFPFREPPDTFAPGLVRKPITPVGQFYVMSKNTVDPALDPDTWRLKLTVEGRILREFTYRELLSLPRVERYQTLRCISNTLKSDLMGTAAWSGIRLTQLLSERELPEGLVEMAVLGSDGHGDSFRLDYAFSEEPLLALGMNGNTLNRQHGYPLRLLVPRYYGLKHVKWISEIAFLREPYYGTWPKMGYTKEPVIHTCSFIDRIRRQGARLEAGGVALSGGRAITAVEVRAGGGSWTPATLEPPLSGYTWTRWRAELDAVAGAEYLEARARDSTGAWQASVEKPLFPDGVSGPTLRRIPT
jgi:DMSO/TMAO reductase YedYZ molybdopterin-dependent catalytic subunit